MRENPGLDHAGTDSADERSLAQIREILFGEHGRQTAEQLARIESRLNAQDAALRELQADVDRRLTLVDSDLHDTAQRLQGALDAQGRTVEALQRQSVSRTQLAELLEVLARQLRAT